MSMGKKTKNPNKLAKKKTEEEKEATKLEARRAELKEIVAEHQAKKKAEEAKNKDEDQDDLEAIRLSLDDDISPPPSLGRYHSNDSLCDNDSNYVVIEEQNNQTSSIEVPAVIERGADSSFVGLIGKFFWGGGSGGEGAA